MTLQQKSQKLFLWLQRYSKTPRTFYNYLATKPKLIYKGGFKAIHRLLLSVPLYAFSKDQTENFDSRNIYAYDEEFQYPSLGTMNGDATEGVLTRHESIIYFFNESNGTKYLTKFNLEDEEDNDVILVTGDISNSGQEILIERRFIDDGLNDMYDRGNFLNTNLTNEWYKLKRSGITRWNENMLACIPYTNTTDSADTALPVDGEEYFGVGSKYFTNHYDKGWVLAVSNASITEFNISGDSGADGNGEVIAQSGYASGYLYFVKQTSSTNDPGICHIILVKDSNDDDIHQEVDTSMYFDDHRILGMVDPTEIYYFLMSLTEIQEEQAVGAVLTSEEIIDFISAVTPLIQNQEIEDVLVNFNTSLESIFYDIAKTTVFSDSGSTTELIYEFPLDTVAAVYTAGQLAVLGGNGYAYNCSTDGVITFVSRIYQSCKAMFEYQGMGFVIYTPNDEDSESQYACSAIPLLIQNEEHTPLFLNFLESDFDYKTLEIVNAFTIEGSVYLIIEVLQFDGNPQFYNALAILDMQTGDVSFLELLPDNLLFTN